VNLLLPRHCSSDDAIRPALLGLRGDSSEPSLPLKLLLRLLLLLKLPCERATLLLLLSLSLLLRRVLLPDKLRWLLLVRRLLLVLFVPGCWNSSAMWLWPVCIRDTAEMAVAPEGVRTMQGLKSANAAGSLRHTATQQYRCAAK
jgi:hypothetical protein